VRYLALITKVVAFLLLLGFAVKNSEAVALRYLLGWEWQVPLSLLLLIAFAIGLALGMLGSTRRVYRLKREIVRLNKHLDRLGSGLDRPLESGGRG
jgi:uncharacterized integral membrane protein